MKCPACGNELSNPQKYCTKCRALLFSVSETATVIQSKPPVNPITRFIGQKNAVSQLTAITDLSRNLAAPVEHLLIVGPDGMGKRTLALVCAEAMGSNTIELDAATIARLGDFTAIVTSLKVRDFLLIQNIGSLRPSLRPTLRGPFLSALQQYKIELVIGAGPGARRHPYQLNRFTCIATAHRESDCPPELREAFALTVPMESYSQLELERLATLIAARSDVEIEPPAVKLIAGACGGTPHQLEIMIQRLARLCPHHITEADAAKVLAAYGVKATTNPVRPLFDENDRTGSASSLLREKATISPAPSLFGADATRVTASSLFGEKAAISPAPPLSSGGLLQAGGKQSPRVGANGPVTPKKTDRVTVPEPKMQDVTEPLGSLALDFQNFAKSVPVSMRDFLKNVQVSGQGGTEQANDLTIFLTNDICAFVSNFTKHDGRVSDNRAWIASCLVSWVQGRSPSTFRSPSTVLASEPLRQSKEFIQSLWKTVQLVQPTTITLLQAYDHTFDSKYADQAKNLLRRLANSFLNADGPPSQESKHAFEEYEKFLGAAEGPSTQRIQTAAVAQNANPTKATSAESASSLELLLAQLNSLVGLQQVKQDVTDLANYIKVQQMRRARGLKTPEISLHMVFHGNPGTGKTTVARLLSKIYNALGVVTKGLLVETDRSGLVAGYVGQTALKVKAVAEKALGGILFIDEAYALKRSGDPQDFGNEAIETLLKFMEDNRQDLVVIVAGYPVEMGRFLDANPGLQSRFNKSLSFPDYEPEALMEIFLRLCKESDYKLSEAAQTKLSAYFHVAYQNRDSRFGNARLVRNIFEKAITNVANRVIHDEQAETAALELIEDTDISAVTESETPRALPRTDPSN